ncbi:MAG: thermonuclease family protein [Proteobacteria bacterium]|nr:thermonuclease family protein [Pseudomonadota bacterium]
MMLPVLLVVLALGGVTLGGVTLWAMSASLFDRSGAARLAAASAAPGAQVTADPGQTAVLDADTLRLSNRVVRLAGIDAPERGRTCRDDAGQDFDCGVAATNALAALVREAPVACELRGADRMGHALAVCEAGGQQINRALVDAGWARADRSSPGLEAAETAARSQRRGLWASAQNSW